MYAYIFTWNDARIMYVKIIQTLLSPLKESNTSLKMLRIKKVVTVVMTVKMGGKLILIAVETVILG